MLGNQSLTGLEAICAGSYATLAATSQIKAAMRAYKGRVAPLEVLAVPLPDLVVPPVEVSPVDPVKAPLDPEVPLAEPPPMPHAV